MRVDIEVITEEFTVREIDPNDSWDIGETGLTVLGVSLTRTDRTWGTEVEGSPGDPAVVLVEHYGDGCTFGSSHCVETRGIFGTEREAREAAALIRTDHGYFGWHIDFLYYGVVLP